MMTEHAHGLKNEICLRKVQCPLEIGIAYVNEKFHGPVKQWRDERVLRRKQPVVQVGLWAEPKHHESLGNAIKGFPITG